MGFLEEKAVDIQPRHLGHARVPHDAPEQSARAAAHLDQCRTGVRLRQVQQLQRHSGIAAFSPAFQLLHGFERRAAEHDGAMVGLQMVEHRLPLASSTRLCPICGRPSCLTSAGDKVKKPLKPVSITASISCSWPPESTDHKADSGFQVAVDHARDHRCPTLGRPPMRCRARWPIRTNHTAASGYSSVSTWSARKAGSLSGGRAGHRYVSRSQQPDGGVAALVMDMASEPQ